MRHLISVRVKGKVILISNPLGNDPLLIACCRILRSSSFTITSWTFFITAYCQEYLNDRIYELWWHRFRAVDDTTCPSLPPSKVRLITRRQNPCWSLFSEPKNAFPFIKQSFAFKETIKHIPIGRNSPYKPARILGLENEGCFLGKKKKVQQIKNYVSSHTGQTERWPTNLHYLLIFPSKHLFPSLKLRSRSKYLLSKHGHTSTERKKESFEIQFPK